MVYCLCYFYSLSKHILWLIGTKSCLHNHAMKILLFSYNINKITLSLLVMFGQSYFTFKMISLVAIISLFGLVTSNVSTTAQGTLLQYMITISIHNL